MMMLISYLNIQMCLSADPYTCRQDTRTGDGRFFMIENTPLEQLPPILWTLCAIFYNVWNVQGVHSGCNLYL